MCKLAEKAFELEELEQEIEEDQEESYDSSYDSNNFSPNKFRYEELLNSDENQNLIKENKNS